MVYRYPFSIKVCFEEIDVEEPETFEEGLSPDIDSYFETHPYPLWRGPAPLDKSVHGYSIAKWFRRTVNYFDMRLPPSKDLDYTDLADIVTDLYENVWQDYHRRVFWRIQDCLKISRLQWQEN